MPKEHLYSNYIMTNERNRVLYTGITNNLPSRVMDYKVNRHPGSFAGRYGLTKLVYYSTTDDVNAAISEEKRIKGGSRKKKILLIESMNAEWNDLSAEIGVDEEAIEEYKKWLMEQKWDKE